MTQPAAAFRRAAGFTRREALGWDHEAARSAPNEPSTHYNLGKVENKNDSKAAIDQYTPLPQIATQ